MTECEEIFKQWWSEQSYDIDYNIAYEIFSQGWGSRYFRE
jgi:hypothetical protein